MTKPKNLTIKSLLISAIFWVFPVISLVSTNLGQIQLNSSIRVILILSAVSVVLLFITGKLFKSSGKALFFSCLIAFLFSTYGHVYFAVEKFHIGNILIGRHRYLVLLFISLLIVGLYFIYRMKDVTQKGINILMPVACLLFVIPFIQIMSYVIRQSESTPGVNAESTNGTNAVDTQLPDIYFFVLDGYGRSDLIKDSVAYDNSGFINFLSKNKFYVAKCSQSNYTSTWFSIASMLNMDYQESMPPKNGETRTVLSMVPYIKHSIVRTKLESKGYHTVAFETGYGFTEITDADVYLQPAKANIFRVLTGRMNAFELFYLRTTLVSAWMDHSDNFTDNTEKSIKLERQDYLYSALLNEVLKINSPKFVFAHILTTHKPFVYEQKSYDQDPVVSQLGVQTRGYHDLLAYSDKMMTQVIQNILSSSKIPPIIIITGDHGPSLNLPVEEAVRNIYAIYLGGYTSEQLHFTMTPVNSFRIVFDSVFNEKYPLLQDRSFAGEDRNQLIPIGNPCASQ